MRGGHAIAGLGVVAAACLWAAPVGAGQASGKAVGKPAAPPAVKAPPKMYPHTLGGMFGRFSWQAHKRPWYEHVLWYLPSRAADLLDVVGIEFSVGQGVHANLHLTRFAQMGIGRVYGWSAGLMGRSAVVVEQNVEEKAFGWWWEFELYRKAPRAEPTQKLDINAADVLRSYHREVDPLGIGGSFFFGLVGISFELKPHEMLDLIKGFLTIDSLGDDY